jgi:predicted dithiol-disulfide oxidoreductase (DUF899 family)
MEKQTMQIAASKAQPAIVSQEEWLNARKQLLLKEKEFTHAYDKLRLERLALPWRAITKEYVFDSANGKIPLADLFDGRSQLIIQHFMFGPDWSEGCVGCSFGADHAQAALVHLNNHDVSYVAVSRAPVGKIEAFKKRMGWTFPWVSSLNNDFNFDFNVSFRPEDIVDGKVYYNYGMQPYGGEEAPGDSAFYKDEHGNIFHTYSSYARGGENQISAYMILDTAPLGRNEGEGENLTSWVRHHDKYNASGYVDAGGRYVAEKMDDSCCHKEEHTNER